MIKVFQTLLNKKYRNKLILAFIGSILASILELIGVGAIPAFIIVITDQEKLHNLLTSNNLIFIVNFLNTISVYQLILISAASLFLIFLIKNIFLTFLILFEGIILRNFTTDLSLRLFRIYINSPTILHLQRNPANTIRNVTDEIEHVRAAIRATLVIGREILTFAIIFLFVVIIDPILSLSIFITLGATSFLFVLYIQKKLEFWGEKHLFYRGKQIQTINQGIGSIKDIKILKRQKFIFDIFFNLTHGRMHYHFIQQFFSQVPRRILEIVSIISILIIVLIFIFLDRPVENILPVLSLLAVAIIRFVPSLNAITSSYSTMKFYYPSLKLIANELNLFEKYNFDISSNKKEYIAFEKIEFKNVNFKYIESKNLILKDINFTIKSKEVIGIIGKTGSGKTTLVEILNGLLKPTSGDIIVNDNLNFDNNLNIGYVPQDIYLIDDTIANNIAFGIPEEKIDIKRVYECIKLSNLSDFVNSCDKKIDTIVGDRGIKLSGGQKQRIGIARCLYNNPSIMIFDEGTSALDNETESEVVKNIFSFKEKKTIIIVAHRLTTVRNCDNLFLIDNGNLKDSGDFKYLSSKYNFLQNYFINEE